MDATRSRRTRDSARQRWYSQCRTRRFARRCFSPKATVSSLYTARR